MFKGKVSISPQPQLQEVQWFMERSKTSIQQKMESGEYLPLSVWGAKGWPVGTMEEQCCDYIMHPQLQIPLYRVVTLTISAGQEEKATAGERLTASCASNSVLAPKGKAKAADAAKPKAAKLPKADSAIKDWSDAEHEVWVALGPPSC